MVSSSLDARDHVIVEGRDFEKFLEVLGRQGYRVLGPTRRDGAIVYDDVTSVAELPAGWMDEQEGGTYRLKNRTDAAFFGYGVGPHAWKKFLQPPMQQLWQARRNGTGFHPEEETREASPLAFLGVRPCDLHAIGIQDKVHLEGSYPDTAYRRRRENVFLIAVNCTQAGGTCFCASMGTGPKAASGFDLALTEVLNHECHFFVVEVGSRSGAELLAEVPHAPARDEDKELADHLAQETAARMGRSLETRDIKEVLHRNLEHPRWERVAERCLTCANCTMVCPTCFCTTVEDVTDLAGERAERCRKWDSCFTMDFSYIHGGSVRYSPQARYRQWMTHKLGTWMEQFGTLGCVGCGRCITWCPVGIDITEEMRAIRETDQKREEPEDGNA